MKSRRIVRRPGRVALVVTVVASTLGVPAAAGADTVVGRWSEVPVGATNGIDRVVTFVGGRRPLTPPTDRPPEDVAEAFVERNRGSFGTVEDSELVTTDAADTLDGGRAVRFQQRVDGVPVLGGEIVVKVDDDGRVRSTAGEVVPDSRIEPAIAPAVDTTPGIDSGTAAATARAATARIERVDSDELSVATPTLWIYDPVLIGAPAPPSPL